jgi:hypothetical protein
LTCWCIYSLILTPLCKLVKKTYDCNHFLNKKTNWQISESHLYFEYSKKRGSLTTYPRVGIGVAVLFSFCVQVCIFKTTSSTALGFGKIEAFLNKENYWLNLCMQHLSFKLRRYFYYEAVCYHNWRFYKVNNSDIKMFIVSEHKVCIKTNHYVVYVLKWNILFVNDSIIKAF